MTDRWAGYVAGWKWRWADLRRRERERAEQARAALPALVAALRRHGARRVVLFGSLATARFGLDSDIDVAVEGVKDVFAAVAEAEAGTEFTVDVVPLESAFPHICERVRREGEVLHGGTR